MIVPIESISTEALEGLIEEFVTRDGTDYGYDETPLISRVEQVKKKLQNKEIVVLFNEATDEVNLVLSERLKG
ncbi:YheU family protein [Neptunomonas japonica]|uniref:YheU family protein n=1 Tax=Neptunomonas japonica TaxID=417574 RepID=UPI000409776A|nr:YheU family protein [Neptunomonas japonica]